VKWSLPNFHHARNGGDAVPKKVDARAEHYCFDLSEGEARLARRRQKRISQIEVPTICWIANFYFGPILSHSFRALILACHTG
jgi:hypothetical protein